MTFDKSVRNLARSIELNPYNRGNILKLYRVVSRKDKKVDKIFILFDSMNYSIDKDKNDHWDIEPECVTVRTKKQLSNILEQKIELIQYIIQDINADKNIESIEDEFQYIFNDIKNGDIKSAVDSCNDILKNSFPENNFSLYIFCKRIGEVL